MMRNLIIGVLCAVPVFAQSQVQVINTSRMGAGDFQVGDHFEVVISGAPNQPISVRTTFQGRTDWSAVIGRTNASGQWSTTGQYGKRDFGDWSEVWTLGGKVAAPAVHFFVMAPCLAGGQNDGFYMGSMRMTTCETVEGFQTFSTPSDSEPFRTPDGRMAPGRTQSKMTVEQYRWEIIEDSITGNETSVRSLVDGDEAAALISKSIGSNALSDKEMRKVLAVIRAAFEKRNIPEAAKNPVATLVLLQNMADVTEQEDLKQEIAEMRARLLAS